MQKEDKIFITGHNGLLGSNLLKVISSRGYSNIIVADRQNLDLTNTEQVSNFFKLHSPKYIFHCAAKAGGIKANTDKPFDFISQNLLIQNNCILSAFENKAKKFLFVSTTCIYPKDVKQPMKEDDLLSGFFTKEMQPYCIAKTAGMEMISSLKHQNKFNGLNILLPNLYGPNDHYGDDSNHVIPALIEKFVNAKINQAASVNVWGSGTAVREFLHTSDAADGLIFLMKNYNSSSPINLSSEVNVSIKELAYTIAKIINYSGEIIFDTSMPEGAPIKVSDDSLINKLGWKSKITLAEGLQDVILDYCRRFSKDRAINHLV